MEKLKQIVEKLFEEKKEIFYNQNFRYKNGNFGINAMVKLVESHTNFQVVLICLDNSKTVDYKKVLDRIFSKSPIPNNLKTPKSKYLDRKLEFGAIYNIITKYAPEVSIYFDVVPKQP